MLLKPDSVVYNDAVMIFCMQITRTQCFLGYIISLVDVFSRNGCGRSGRDPDEGVPEQIPSDEVCDQDIQGSWLRLISQDHVVLEIQRQEGLVEAVKDEQDWWSSCMRLDIYPKSLG